MRRFLLFSALLILLFSCEKGSFEFTASTLRLESVNGRERLLFSVDPSDEESSYFISISSPGGLLTWQGELEADGDGRFKIPLDITKLSSFPQGEYVFTLYSSSGMSVNGSVMFLREEFSPFLSDGIIAGVMEGEGEIDGTPVALGSAAESGDVLTYQDQYFNSYEKVL